MILQRAVLDEAIARAQAAGSLETGGVLLGRLARDSDSGDLLLEVTAQVPAVGALAEEASLRFTPGTWQAVQAALRLRHSGEHMVGWWHSHPHGVWPCRNCPPERRAVCPSNRAFFSTMDVAVHRTAFAGALNVSLLISFLEGAEPHHNLFGWHQGMVRERGYHVVETILLREQFHDTHPV